MKRWALTGAVSLALLAGCGLPPIPGAEPSPAPSGPTAVAPAVVPPTAVNIPALKARSTLVALGLNPDQTLEVPPVDQPLQAGYLDWSDDIEPTRPLVIAAHVDGCTVPLKAGKCPSGKHGPGLFQKLKTLKPGDRVEVERADGTRNVYEITKVDQVPKGAFPTRAVYDPTDRPSIRLITCGGDFDPVKRSYVDNYVAYGEIVRD